MHSILWVLRLLRGSWLPWKPILFCTKVRWGEENQRWCTCSAVVLPWVTALLVCISSSSCLPAATMCVSGFHLKRMESFIWNTTAHWQRPKPSLDPFKHVWAGMIKSRDWRLLATTGIVPSCPKLNICQRSTDDMLWTFQSLVLLLAWVQATRNGCMVDQGCYTTAMCYTAPSINTTAPCYRWHIFQQNSQLNSTEILSEEAFLITYSFGNMATNSRKKLISQILGTPQMNSSTRHSPDKKHRCLQRVLGEVVPDVLEHWIIFSWRSKFLSTVRIFCFQVSLFILRS